MPHFEIHAADVGQVNDATQFAQDSPEPVPAELWTDIYADVIPQEKSA